jgi:hypothetical protein
MRGAISKLAWVSVVIPPVLLALFLLMIPYNEYAARRDVLDYLKLSADAPTLRLAERHLSTAVRNMEARGWTTGSTALIFKTPRRDLGFWYQNTRGALVDLRELLALEATLAPVDRSNALVKLRETLMDGSALTFPEWVELAPHNALFFWAILLGSIGSVYSGLVGSRMIRQGPWAVAPLRTPRWLQAFWSWIDRQAVLLDSTHWKRR